MARGDIKLLIRFLIVVAALALAYVLFRAFYYAPNGEVPLSPGTLETAAIRAVTGKPLRLEIPRLGIDADVQHVGVTKSGNMAAPNNFVDVGWYKYGTIPGNTGSAVIAGHVNNGVAFPAVFAGLKELVPGDEIYITNENGQRLQFIVTGSSVYDFNAKADEVFLDDSAKLLKLITCTGVFVEQYRTHNKRLVVSAVLSEQL